ncbi:MerR family transcriptional regulator [Streptomyces sp. WAC 06783]|uniref:MerR family transcriptional regulator n=1 Tax=Streptomyces sp. WAC 06783 TaxID=2203211 RepID=UPI000F745F38|nr:MerR family transcriptional regulator [Streptomyces sp. WAC 06783]RSO07858.1 MerR family transcriptional regulator [Streptomyces sp. WAC 06783]
MTTATTWKVGQLAEASGLTVRTLHHWDTIGLLSPSRRTPGGHREYTEDDAARLYQVLALRGLGLGLETIATCLDSGIDPLRLVRDHLAGVEESLSALEALRGRLRRLEESLSAGTAPEARDLLAALKALGRTGPTADRALRRHLDADQLQVLAARGAALGPAAHYLLEVEWPELYRRAARLREAGVPPTDRRVRRLAARMDELGVLFSGGDAGVSAGVRAAWRAEPEEMAGGGGSGFGPGAGSSPGPGPGSGSAPDAWRELADYLDRARTEPDGLPHTPGTPHTKDHP